MGGKQKSSTDTVSMTLVVFENLTVTAAAESIQDAVKQVAFLQSLPQACPICKESLVFTHRTPQSFDYYGMQCTGTPVHALDFHEYDGGGFYLKRGERFEVKQFGSGQVAPEEPKSERATAFARGGFHPPREDDVKVMADEAELEILRDLNPVDARWTCETRSKVTIVHLWNRAIEKGANATRLQSLLALHHITHPTKVSEAGAKAFIADLSTIVTDVSRNAQARRDFQSASSQQQGGRALD